MNLKKYLEEKRKIINHALDKYLRFNKGYPQILIKAMRYSIFAGGKRLRPLLVLASAQVCGGKGYKKPLGVACALEMIHTYSLIHDDLPAMDNDDYRRNKLTCHKKFGEAVAILAGDALLTYAFQIMSESPQVKKELIKELAEAAGIGGMIGGQVEDIQNSRLESQNLKIKGSRNLHLQNKQKAKIAKKIKYVHTHKTGMLIKTSLKAGALAVGASEKQVKVLEKYGEDIGLAFQIVDDILDITGDKKKLGKRGSDRDNKKLTYPLIYGIEKSKKKAKDLVEKAKEMLVVFGKKADILRKMADYIVNREY